MIILPSGRLQEVQGKQRSGGGEALSSVQVKQRPEHHAPEDEQDLEGLPEGQGELRGGGSGYSLLLELLTKPDEGSGVFRGPDQGAREVGI